MIPEIPGLKGIILNLLKIRKISAGIVFALFLILFVGPEAVSVILAQVLPPFQFTPALIRTLTQPGVLFAAGLIFLVVITIVFGRVYCSFLCPLGILQDLLSAVFRKLGFATGFTYSRPRNALRYSLLAITVIALSAGFLSWINLLDPYSLAGRVLAHLVQPLCVGAYNLGIMALKPFNIYLYPRQMILASWPALGFTAVFLLLIAYLSAKHGRLYCNTVCPVGTFLGLLSRMSFFKLTLDQKGCSGCVRCANVCKAGCIDDQAMSIDMSRCVGCFNCLDVCSKSAIRYRLFPEKRLVKTWSPQRRSFVAGGLGAAGALLLAVNSGIRTAFGGGRPTSDAPVTPPGSAGIDHFTQACTACSLCVSICPTAVLTPAFLDYGPAGLMQPKMNYEKSYCDYECNACGRVCPTGAIRPIGLDEKKLTQIGEARLLEDVCVVFVKHNNCGACGEVCPTHAISFVDKENILYPQIEKKYCIGCGACRLACPTTPRSIVIQAHAVHKKAERYALPAPPVQDQKSDVQDFPF